MNCIDCHDPIIPNEDQLCEKCLENMLSEHITVETFVDTTFQGMMDDYEYDDMIANGYPGEYDGYDEYDDYYEDDEDEDEEDDGWYY